MKRITIERASHVSARQDADEEHNEAYRKYGERASQSATQYSTTSQNGIAGHASEQILTVRSFA